MSELVGTKKSIIFDRKYLSSHGIFFDYSKNAEYNIVGVAGSLIGIQQVYPKESKYVYWINTIGIVAIFDE